MAAPSLRRLLPLLLAAGWALPAAADPPDPGLELLEEAREGYDRSGPEEALEDAGETPARPWTLQARLDAEWASNPAGSAAGAGPGAVLAPEVTLWRAFVLGRLHLFAEVGAIAYRSMDDNAFDGSSLFGTLEVEAGDRTKGPTAYAAWEPDRGFAGVFAEPVGHVHTLTAGVRRDFGPTFLDVYLRRVEVTGAGLDRSGGGVQLLGTVPFDGWRLALRGDLDWRRFDLVGEAPRRHDLRARLRARAIVPLSAAIDLQLTAELTRNASTLADRRFTNLTIGPTLVARTRF